MTDQPEVEASEVTAEHARLLAALDPLLPEPAPLAATDDERLLSALDGASAAVGLTRTDILAPDSELALWSPLRQHRLTVQLAGPDRGAALDALLARWDILLGERVEVGDRDSAAGVTLASRDIEPARMLALNGFAPLIVVAARRHGATARPPSRTADVRLAEPADLDAIVELAAQLHRADTRFGVVTARPAAQQLLRGAVARQLQEAPDWTWVCDVDGEVGGFAQVQPPSGAGWVAPLTAAGPAAYFGYLFVRPELRGGGVGAALAAAAHHELDKAGVAVTLLHHALPSPHSTPFWARQGYRPLWTSWQRRPAVR